MNIEDEILKISRSLSRIEGRFDAMQNLTYRNAILASSPSDIYFQRLTQNVVVVIAVGTGCSRIYKFVDSTVGYIYIFI